MGIFKDRSLFFRSLANLNKNVAHGRVVDGEERNAFHRLNDEEELQAACVSYAHFPCMVHFGFFGRYTSEGGKNISKRKLQNGLAFLQKADPTDMNAVEDAYDLTFDIVEQIISWMFNDFNTKGYCSNFDNLDLARFSFSPYVVNGNLFGWLLQFEDDKYAESITVFDAGKWYAE